MQGDVTVISQTISTLQVVGSLAPVPSRLYFARRPGIEKMACLFSVFGAGPSTFWIALQSRLSS